MKNKKLAIILCLFSLNVCSSPSSEKFQKIGSFNKLSARAEDSNELNIEKNLRKFEKCYFLEKYRYNENFINTNLDKLADGDNTIIGFRYLRIEYTLQILLSSWLGSSFGIYCVTYTGYAIRKKEKIKVKDDLTFHKKNKSCLEKYNLSPLYKFH